VPAPELLGIRNEISDKVSEAEQELEEQLNQVVASTSVKLTIEDPEEVDETGMPLWVIRTAETNLGDLCADAYRDQTGADIAFANGGSIRVNIEKGDITYGDIISVHPFGNMICVLEVTGQQILDALEWGSRALPADTGAFLQVSGLSYEINTAIDSPCLKDEKSLFAGIEGQRRVQNVMVGEEPLDPEKTYSLAGNDYILRNNGDGFTMFDQAPVLQDNVKLDNQVLIDYIVDTLGGEVGEEYADPYGQGRITILE
jgi:2',3'-cyclic-nucleotide 2'-phosphodiesterase (5'-nucleotidase family)